MSPQPSSEHRCEKHGSKEALSSDFLGSACLSTVQPFVLRRRSSWSDLMKRHQLSRAKVSREQYVCAQRDAGAGDSPGSPQGSVEMKAKK